MSFFGKRLAASAAFLTLCSFLLPSSGHPSAPADKLLWDAWYTISLNDGSRYGYYNDRVELRRGRVYFSNRVWKKEEDYINEEQLGAYAEADKELTPLFYNFHSTYRTTETRIDGTVSSAGSGRILTVKVRRGENELPQVRKSLSPKTLFSSLFPVWLKDRAAEMKSGQSLPFVTVIEDNVEQSFATVTGRVRREKDEPGSKLSKFLVDYKGVKSFWYLDSAGVAEKIEMPAHGTLVQRVPAETAKKYLEP